MVPGTGVEPARPYEHNDLNVACLPIPTSGQERGTKITAFSLLFNPPCHPGQNQHVKEKTGSPLSELPVS